MPLAISNNAPTPFSKMPTSNDWWRIDLRCMVCWMLRRMALQHRQLLGKMLAPIHRQRFQPRHSPQQSTICSAMEKVVDVTYRDAVRVFLDTLDRIARGHGPL